MEAPRRPRAHAKPFRLRAALARPPPGVACKRQVVSRYPRCLGVSIFRRTTEWSTMAWHLIVSTADLDVAASVLDCDRPELVAAIERARVNGARRGSLQLEGWTEQRVEYVFDERRERVVLSLYMSDRYLEADARGMTTH